MTTEQKIDKLLEGQGELKIEMARFIVHQENHAKDIKELQDYKEKDKELKNKAIGGFSILTILGSAVTSWIFKHF
jgi:hypothetical protein